MNGFKRVLFVAAEQQEIDVAKAVALQNAQAEYLLTGVGITATTYHLLKKIMEARAEGCGYDLIIELGIAGSYNMERFPDGSVALISREYFADLGFETLFGFKTLFDSYLPADTYPFRGGALERFCFDNATEKSLLEHFPEGVGVTVQTITGTPAREQMLREKFTPDIESMEGAALFYVALMEHIPFLQLRSVSNRIGLSDSSKWSTALALRNLKEATETACRIFNL